jgi:hypothetical protein
MDAEDWLRTVE